MIAQRERQRELEETERVHAAKQRKDDDLLQEGKLLFRLDLTDSRSAETL
jgi:hypothetical protein